MTCQRCNVECEVSSSKYLPYPIYYCPRCHRACGNATADAKRQTPATPRRADAPLAAQDRQPGHFGASQGISPADAKKPLIRARREFYDDRWFDSATERRHYQALKLREAAGEIEGLACQVPYDLVVNGSKVGRYTADFEWRERDGTIVTADAKGYATPLFRLRARLFAALYGREILLLS